jgi:hypothetical protein
VKKMSSRNTKNPA